MGNACNNPDTKQQFQIQKTSQTLELYLKCRWLTDPIFQQRIKHLKQQQQWKELTDNIPLRKHRNKNEYYIGPFDHDQPKGKGIIYKPHVFFYYGQVDRKPHGLGIYESLQHGFVYNGEFLHGKIQGLGKYNQKDIYIFQGQINQKGEPRSGKITVNGLQNKQVQSTVYLDNYPVNNARIQHADGRLYQGQINLKKCVPHGYGICKYPNNSIYEGYWQSGEFSGRGKFTWSDGSNYQGEYYSGKKHGNGKLIYSSLNYYDGQWKQGKQDGNGVLYNKNGIQLKRGIWQEGSFLNDNQS